MRATGKVARTFFLRLSSLEEESSITSDVCYWCRYDSLKGALLFAF